MESSYELTLQKGKYKTGSRAASRKAGLLGVDGNGLKERRSIKYHIISNRKLSYVANGKFSTLLGKPL